MQEEKLPNSMLSGKITLIPKKGELILLSNWRPITLLNTDYKLIKNCLARMAISVLHEPITTDQSYCIPNRNIHTNLHLIRDSIDHANQHDRPLAVTSLDEASAHDCVEHPYILHTLEKFGFGKTFIQNMCTAMHRDCSRLMESSRRHSNVEEEYDKGTPIFGPLSTLTTVQFLLLRKSILRDYGLKIPPSRKQNTGHQRICR
jgi:hypothetical protein